MNCEEAINLMDGYLDGELDPLTGQNIEQQLTRYQRPGDALRTSACDQFTRVFRRLDYSFGLARSSFYCWLWRSVLRLAAA